MSSIKEDTSAHKHSSDFNLEENSENNINYPYASPDFFIKVIPRTITKEKFDTFYSEIYLKKLNSIKNLLDIDPKSSSELQNYLIFLTQFKKEFYVNGGKILISIKPQNLHENQEYFTLKSWCESTLDKKIAEWPSHIYTLAHSVYINMINSQKDQCISLIGKMGSGKSYNALKIIQYLFFISSNSEIRRDQYDLVNKGIKLMQVVGNVYQSENIENSSCGFVFHIGFQNNEISIFDFDSEILDMTLPFSENGRSFTLLHGFLLTQEKYFNIKNTDFNFFKKYNNNFQNNIDEFEYYQKKDVENFKVFTDLCQVFISQGEYTDILNLLYIILLCNQVTILKNLRYINGKREQVFFISEDPITKRISNLLGIDIKEFLSIFQEDNWDHSLDKHKNILVAFMKYSYYCIHDFLLNKIKEKLKRVFHFFNNNKNPENQEKIKTNFIHIIDFPGEKNDQTLGGMTLNYANECLYLYSICNYTAMLSTLENNNVRLKKYQAPLSYDIMKSLVNSNGILTFLNSNPKKQSNKFEELVTKSDNIPTIIQFIKQKQLINVHYTYLSTFYFFQDLLKESKTVIINKKMINIFRKTANKILLKTTIITMHKHFLISDYINDKLKYLFCGIENIEPFLVNCISSDEILNENLENKNCNIFNGKRNIIINSLNWAWYGYEEWIMFDTFLEKFLSDFEVIKNNYNDNLENIMKIKKYKDISKHSSRNNTDNNKSNNNSRNKVEEIINVYNLNNDCLIGNKFLIMKKGTLDLLSKIQKTLLNNINKENNDINFNEIEKIKNLPISKKILKILLKQHQINKKLNNENNKNENNKKEIKTQESIMLGNKIINLNIMSDEIFKFLNELNYYHINNMLLPITSKEKNKNNIVLPKNPNTYSSFQYFFDINKIFSSDLYDIEPLNQFFILIQKNFRGYQIRKKFTYIYKYVRYYVIILQKYIRGFVLRRKFNRFISCLKKIIFIQIYYKAYFQRKTTAAKIIQKKVRVFIQNKHNNFNKYFDNNKNILNVIYPQGSKKNFFHKNINNTNKNEKNIQNNNTSNPTKELIKTKEPNKIIKILLYNKKFMIDADKEFNTDYYRTIYKEKFIYPYIRNYYKNINQPQLEDRLIRYGEDMKLRHLLDNTKYHENECINCSFKPKINDNYLFENSFNERCKIYLDNKQKKRELNLIKEQENLKKNCTFKPKINRNDLKRNVNDLFEWQQKINKEKEEMKELYEKFKEEQIQKLINYKPKNNYYTNMKYLEKINNKNLNEECKERNENNNNMRETNSKSSFSTNPFVDFQKVGDIWPADLDKNFP